MQRSFFGDLFHTLFVESGAGLTLIAFLPFVALVFGAPIWYGVYTFEAFHGAAICLVLTIAWPAIAKMRYRRQQNTLLFKVRAHYATALEALTAGKRAIAEDLLLRIRRLEGRWRLGNSRLYRAAQFLQTLGVTAVFCLGYVTFKLSDQNAYIYGCSYHQPDCETLLQTAFKIVTEPIPLIVTGLILLVFVGGAMAHYGSVEGHDRGELYSDSLEQTLNAGDSVSEADWHDGVEIDDYDSALDLFGLRPSFKKSDLRRAWLKLARELHPDRWGNASAGVRQMKEAALKRVNAAKDELEPYAI